MCKNFFLVLCATLALFADDVLSGACVVMPEGFADVYIGMPLADFLSTRKGVQSGTGVGDMIGEGVSTWFNDPNNPKMVDWGRGYHKFKEKSKHQIFNGLTVYSFSNRELSSISWGGMLAGGDKKQIAAIFGYAVNKWGVPDDIAITEDIWSDGTHKYVLRVVFWRKETRINLDIPLRKDGDCYCRTTFCPEKYLCRLLRKYSQTDFFNLHMTTRIGNEGRRGYFVGGTTSLLTDVERDGFLLKLGLEGIVKNVSLKQNQSIVK